MLLLPLDRQERFKLATYWLTREDIAPWVDFRLPGREMSPRVLRVLGARDSNEIRLFTDDRDARPIGIVGLSDINRDFGTGKLWFALGETSFARCGYSTRAASRMVDQGFRNLGLRSINAWVVQSNVSANILERLGFRTVGRQRHCHVVDGRVYDRILYDLLPADLRSFDAA